MELFRDGVAAFLEAVGIAAVLWVLFDWFMYPKGPLMYPFRCLYPATRRSLSRFCGGWRD